MGEFARRHGLDDYASLHEWSIADIDRFWLAFSEWANIEWTDRSAHAIQELAMPAKWFDGASLNFASHALRMGGGIISVSQTRPRVELTADELRAQVRACRRGLTSLGVQKGDVVASYLPNVSETVVAFLATASLGAVWTSCAPEFGVKAVTDRLTQLAPKVLFSVDGYVYGTK
jgi:acetoacetyl-CoA synthetase